MKKHDDLVYETAKETGYSIETVNFVVLEFWKAVRYFITHPLETKRGILLTHFGKFYINPWVVEQRLHNPRVAEWKKEVYEELLKQLDYEQEGQTFDED